MASDRSSSAGHRVEPRGINRDVFALWVIVSWGALSFGAVYTWALVPLLVASAGVGLAGIWRSRFGEITGYRRHLTMALVLVMGAVAAQLVPVPRALRGLLSPSADPFLQAFDLGYAARQPDWYPLSIRPAATWRGFACLTAFTCLLLGATSRLGKREVFQLARGIGVLAVAMALCALVQKVISPERIYGFWDPVDGGGVVFGPFVNKNHFAGWMLMAVSLTIGYWGDLFSQAFAAVKPRWRHRVAWLSSPAASQVMLTGFAIFVMLVSLFMTLSRSGIVALLAASSLAMILSRRSAVAGASRLVVVGCLVAVAVIALGWVGADRLRARLQAGDGHSLGGRLAIWRDSARIVRDFPVTGTGLNTYSAAILVYQTPDPDKYFSAAHNDYLQLAAEGGVLLGVPAIVLLVTFVRAVRQRLRHEAGATYWTRVGALTGIAAIAVQEVMDFSLQIPGNAALLVVLCAVALHRSERS